MTEAELVKSDKLKDWLAHVLAQKPMADILDLIQRKAIPTANTVPAIVPGVHFDTTLAHDDRYRAGWSDAIEYLRAIPGGRQVIPTDPEEEPFAHLPEVQAIDAEIRANTKP